MASRQGTAVIREAIELALRPDAPAIDLAEKIWKAEHAERGSLKQIIREGRLGQSRAYRLLAIWERFAGLGYSKDDLAAVGWTKLAVVAKHLPPGDEARGIDLAKSKTAKELEAILKGGSETRSKAHSVLLRLSPTQYRVFSLAVRQFGARPGKGGHGLTDKERALTQALKEILSKARRMPGRGGTPRQTKPHIAWGVKFPNA